MGYADGARHEHLRAEHQMSVELVVADSAIFESVLHEVLREIVQAKTTADVVVQVPIAASYVAHPEVGRR